MRYVGNGKIEGGKLHVFNRHEMADSLLHWRDCHVTITVEKQHATRSKPQNDYYWSVVVQRIRVALRDGKAGSRYIAAAVDDHMTHECLKAQFMDPELVRTGKLRGFISEEGLTLGTTTTELNKLQFMDYLDRIIDHSALHWSCYVPPPDPLWREHTALDDEEEGNGDAAA
jgi:hypothetical protein